MCLCAVFSFFLFRFRHFWIYASFVVFVVDGHNFVEQAAGNSDYGFRAYGELSRFVYCLLQKIKKPEVLPPVEHWDRYMLPNHSVFESLDYEHFLSGTTLMGSLERLSSIYVRKEFKKNCWEFFDHFVSCILSSVSARSPIGRGLSSFCPEILIGGDEHSATSLFVELVNALGRLKWLKSTEKEASKSEFQSFVRDQRELEYGSGVRRPEIGNILTTYLSQLSFRSRRNLFKVRISFFGRGYICCCHLYISRCFQVYRLAALFVRGPKHSLNAFTIDLSDIVLPESDVLSAISCVQHFVKDAHFSRRSFFTEKGVESLREAISSSGNVRTQTNYNPWALLKVRSTRAVVGDLSSCHEKVLRQRRGRSANLERLFRGSGPSSDMASDVSSQAGVVRISETVEEGRVTLGKSTTPVSSPKLASILKSAKRDRAAVQFSLASSPDCSPLKKVAASSPTLPAGKSTAWSPKTAKKPVIAESAAFSEALDQQASSSKRRSERKKKTGHANYESFF